MNNFFRYLGVGCIGLTLVACNGSGSKTADSDTIDGSENAASNDATGVTMIYKDGLTLTEVKSQASNASIKLIAPDLTKPIAEGKVEFNPFTFIIFVE